MPHTLTDRLGALAERLARAAGHLAADGRRRGLEHVETKSTLTDMVTEYDRASEALIVETIRAERPDDGVLGEEGTSFTGTSGISWIIDPIDGTTNFLYDLAGWAVSVAASDEHGPLAGAVYLPATDEMFTAVRGGGAWLNGRPIAASACADLATALVGVGFSYRVERRTRQATLVAGLLPRIRDIRQIGSAAGHLCLVAAGRLDAFYEEGLNPWDSAAGVLIAAEAGATVTGVDGGPLDLTRICAAAPGVAEALVAALGSLGAPIT
jgi:fructose-1,6-bisphosphatase/inositol monophosphatase family enzyme